MRLHTVDVSRYTDTQIEPADPSMHDTVRHPATRVVQVFTGYEHSLMMMADGSIWACGRNDAGQCGVSIPGSVDGDITFPLRLTISPGLYALPTAETGCLASGSFLLRKATQVATPPRHAKTQLARTRSTVRLHTPPLPRAIAYDDPAVTLAQTSTQAVAQSTVEPMVVEARILQPAELQSLMQRQKPWIDPDFPPAPISLAHDWQKFQDGDESDLTRGLLWTEIEWKRPEEIKLYRVALRVLCSILFVQQCLPAMYSLLVHVFNRVDIRNGKAIHRYMSTG
jgi:hypothetical protein